MFQKKILEVFRKYTIIYVTKKTTKNIFALLIKLVVYYEFSYSKNVNGIFVVYTIKNLKNYSTIDLS